MGKRDWEGVCLEVIVEVDGRECGEGFYFGVFL